MIYVLPDHINMALFFWYLVEIDLASVRYELYMPTFNKVPETHGHV